MILAVLDTSVFVAAIGWRGASKPPPGHDSVIHDQRTAICGGLGFREGLADFEDDVLDAVAAPLLLTPRSCAHDGEEDQDRGDGECGMCWLPQ